MSIDDVRVTVTIPEAARILGVSRSLAYEAANRGDLPAIRVGRRWIVPKSALERLLSAHDDDPSKRR